MKISITFAFCVVAALAADLPGYKKAEYASPAYPKSYDHPLMPYNFNWAVKDDPSYNDFAHQETSNGKAVSGSYRVLLPDGRVQVVTYKADDYGYVADVQYQGEAKYDYKPAAYKPSYASPAAYPASPTYPKQAYTTTQYTTPAYTTPSYPSTPYSAPAAYPKPSYTKEAYPARPAYPQPSYTTPSYTPAPYKPAKY